MNTLSVQSYMLLIKKQIQVLVNALQETQELCILTYHQAIITFCHIFGEDKHDSAPWMCRPTRIKDNHVTARKRAPLLSYLLLSTGKFSS